MYSPEKYIKVALNGTLVWATAILPSLFPFMIFTRLLTATGYVEDFSKGLSPMTKKLYNTPGISSYIFLMSIISGYPLGAKLTADLYGENMVSREEAHRICSFTSNSGPMFIVGTVGVGMLISATAGYIILISHIIASMLNGLIYRKYKPTNYLNLNVKASFLHRKNKKEFPSLRNKEVNNKEVNNKDISPDLENVGKNNKKNANQEDILTKSMENSISSVLLIGGYITIFFVITEILSTLGVFTPIINLLSLLGVNKQISNGVIFGLFEITKGCLTISSTTASLTLKTILCSFVISFGGFAVAFQAFAFLNKFKISKPYFFLQKFTHALLSLAITIILSLLIVIT